MALHGSYADEFNDAFDIARRVRTSGGGLRTFRRHWPDLDASDSREIWNRVWPRAQRVAYFEDTPGGQFINNTAVGCADNDSHILVNHEVTFADEDGNQHTLNVWTTTAIEPRVGATRDEAFIQLLYNLQGSNYFRDQTLPFIRKAITNHRVMQVKCMAGRRV